MRRLTLNLHRNDLYLGDERKLQVVFYHKLDDPEGARLYLDLYQLFHDLKGEFVLVLRNLPNEFDEILPYNVPTALDYMDVYANYCELLIEFKESAIFRCYPAETPLDISRIALNRMSAKSCGAEHGGLFINSYRCDTPVDYKNLKTIIVDVIDVLSNSLYNDASNDLNTSRIAG